MPPAARLTLVQRQQQLLEERGFSKPKPNQQPKLSFAERQDMAAIKSGRGNATAASRQRVEMPTVSFGMEADDGTDGAASSATRFSCAPSLHPSMAGTAVSMACSEVTIGAGDDTAYWDFQHRCAEKSDLGHKCRECKRPFTKIGEPMTERRGARVSMRYHAECFSGFADPRSQAQSSHHTGRLQGTQLEAAPGGKAGSKMRTSTHFDSGGRLVQQQAQQQQARSSGGGSGKTGMGLAMGSNGFGAKSSKGQGGAAFNMSSLEQDLSGIEGADVVVGRGGGNLSESALKAHNSLSRVEEAAGDDE